MTQIYKLVVASWENDNEYGEGGSMETHDRYFGTSEEILSRLCYPWLDGFAHGIYQRQADGSWLLYYHSI